MPEEPILDDTDPSVTHFDPETGQQLFPELPPLPRDSPPPLPDAQGIAEVKALYKREKNQDLTDEEAYEVLRRVMHFIWAINMAHQYPAQPPATKDEETSE